MKDDDYYRIYDWMINFNLKFNEMNAYAIIYSHDTSGISEADSEIEFLADLMSCTTRTVSTVLDSLVKKGFIFKKTKEGRNGGLRNTYIINHQILIDKGIEESKE